MPYVTSAYLNYLEQLAGGGGAQTQLPTPDIPPAGGGDEPTTAPFGPPGQGGPGSFPAATPTPTPGATPIAMQETPSQWGETTNFVPMTTPAPYQYNDPYGTAAPGNVSIPYPGDQGIAYGGMPAAGQAPSTPVAYPTYATSGMMGYPPATPVGGQVNLGGWGQPAGYFGVPSQGPIGAYGVGGMGGTFYGGGIPVAPGAAGGTASPGAVAYGLGPLPGTPGEFGGGGGMMPGSFSTIVGFHSPQFQQWMAQNNINPHEMLAALTGGGSQPSADVSGAMHAGAGPRGAQ